MDQHTQPRKILLYFILIYLFIFAVLGFKLRASHLLGRYSYHFSHSTSPYPFFFSDGFLWDRVLTTICLWTANLLTSASWVVRIIGVSHQCPVQKSTS
jgi:hypothetical protein